VPVAERGERVAARDGVLPVATLLADLRSRCCTHGSRPVAVPGRRRGEAAAREAAPRFTQP
jgi:hypothetical protein